MKRSKFSDEQILAIVKEGEAGRKVADLCRANGSSLPRNCQPIGEAYALDIGCLGGYLGATPRLVGIRATGNGRHFYLGVERRALAISD